MSSKEEVLEKYTQQLQEVGASVNAELLDWVIDRVGPANYNDDGKFVAFSSEDELNTVYTNFVADELEETDKEKGMTAITEVGEQLDGVSHKYRAVVYYLLAQKYGK